MGELRHDSLLRLPDVQRRTGLHRATIYRKMRDGSFPQAVKLSANCVGWYESHIDAWVANPMAWGVEAA